MKPVFAAGLAALTFLALPAMAGERTVELAVDNMTCATCHYVVRETLAAVPGVIAVDVSLEERTARVTFDEAQTGIEALTAASASNGYPARLAAGTDG